MAVSKVSDTRLFPGKPITAQIMQEFDETQEHIAKRTSDVANDVRAFGSANKFVKPKFDRGLYPVAELDFQIGFFHTSNAVFGTTLLVGSILELRDGFYDLLGFCTFNRTGNAFSGSNPGADMSLYNVNPDGTPVFPNGIFGKNTVHYLNNNTASGQWFSSADHNNSYGERRGFGVSESGVRITDGLYRVGMNAIGTTDAAIQCAGYLQICQRKEVSTCPIGCERGQQDEDTGVVEINSSSSTNTLSNTETAGRTLEPMKIYWG
tara:strand:- start:6017 stop:6808 length:792 start_codon:yes stop_codon:yes gene_type:complete